VVTLNLWNDAAGADRRMAILVRQLQALAPHIVTLQEVRQVPGAREQAAEVASALEARYVFAAADPDSRGGPVGNAILSTYPLERVGTLTLPSRAGDPRVALKCRVATPAGSLTCVTTHLSWELDAAAARERQILAIDEFARADPGDLPTVMTGDFNCTPDSEVHRFLTGRVALAGRSTYWRDAYQRRHKRSDGFTWSARNPYVARSVERDRRIDFIFVAAMRDRGPGAILHARVVCDLPDYDGVFPSDHFGVFAEIACIPVDDPR
jgi:endonuclease/exonuclease/phosphatase family metal-dependent hydrolase